MKVSLILASIGRTDEVGRCLASLAKQSDRNFEVLLIDQNQDDRLLKFIHDAIALGLVVSHLRLSKASLSGARNLGIARATGDVLGFTDDDCWYEPNAIKEIRSSMLADSGLGGVVACWVEQAEASPRYASRNLLSLSGWRQFRDGDASSITLFLKKDILSSLNGFDERFGVGQWFGAAEETDVVLRALAAGVRIARCPNARVHHNLTSVLKGNWLAAAKAARSRARGTGAIYAKHRISMWVIVRGLAAPILRPLAHVQIRLFIIGLFVSYGRLEGQRRWKRLQRNDENSEG